MLQGMSISRIIVNIPIASELIECAFWAKLYHYVMKGQMLAVVHLKYKGLDSFWRANNKSMNSPSEGVPQSKNASQSAGTNTESINLIQCLTQVAWKADISI